MSNHTVFENRIKVLRHAAKRYPCRFGVNDVADLMDGSQRKKQRLLVELVNYGYLESDNCNPKGYKLIKGKFEEFQGL